MIEPYQAIGLVSTMWGIRRREEIAKNLEHIEHLFKAAFWLGGLDQPLRLVAIPEGALQGFTDEGMDLDHETYARECAIDVPGAVLQRRLHHRAVRRGDLEAPQGRAAAAGRALGDAAQRVGPLDRALRLGPGRVLSG